MCCVVKIIICRVIYFLNVGQGLAPAVSFFTARVNPRPTMFPPVSYNNCTAGPKFCILHSALCIQYAVPGKLSPSLSDKINNQSPNFLSNPVV